MSDIILAELIEAARLKKAQWAKPAMKRYHDKHKDDVDPEQTRIWHEHSRIIRRDILRKTKEDQGCIRCGEKNSIVLEFHHRNPNEKELNSQQLLGYALKRVLEEIAKCDIVCANCHRIIHEELRSDQGRLE